MQFWGDKGSGILAQSQDTCKFLIAKRSQDVNEPGSYGVIGGRIEPNEDARLAAIREFREETEYGGPIQLSTIYKFKYDSFTYETFLGKVPEEFTPILNWENDETKWVTANELLELKDKHFGIEDLIKKKGEGYLITEELKCRMRRKNSRD